MPELSENAHVQSASWQAIAQLSSRLGELADSEARHHFLTGFLRQLFGVPAAQFLPIARNFSDMDERPGTGTAAFLEYVARQDQPMVVSGVEAEDLSQLDNLPPLLAELRWKTLLLAPVTTPGRAVGVLVLADEVEREFTADEVAMLNALVPQTAFVLDTATLDAENRYKESYARALGELDTMIASYDISAILRFGVRKIQEVLQVERVLVYSVNPDSGAVRLAVAEGEGARGDEAIGPLAVRALKERHMVVVGPGDEGAPKHAIAAPVMASNNIYGVIEVVEKRNQRPFHRNEVGFVHQVAMKLALVIQNTHAYLTINRLNEGLEEKVKERTNQLEEAIKRLQETQAQLMQSEKLASVGTLAGGIAHEVNNPLSAILANVQLLRLDLEDDEQLESLTLIESGAKRCMTIVENLMNYSKEAATEHQSLSLNAVLGDALETLAPQARRAQVRVSFDFGELPPVLGNSSELAQIFTHLLVNALDALVEKGPGMGHVGVRSFVEGKFAVVTVVDDGCGMDAALVRKIFDPFFTTKQVGQGTGLGLSVSQQIAVNHGGRIEVASDPGEGSTFKVYIPVAHGASR